MFNLTKNYIDSNYKLQGTCLAVLLDGVYQPKLSDCINIKLNDQGVTIAADDIIDNPLHLLFLYSKDCDFNFNIGLGAGSRINVIEEHEILNEGVFGNKINIELESKSELVHHRLQLSSDEASSLRVTTVIKQKTQSRFDSSFVSKGSRKYLDQIEVKLLEEEASYNVKGISLLDDNQVMDQKMLIEHLAPNCRSNVLSKVIVDDSAINSFDCRVLVPAKIGKTEAHVNNRNLLLSENATANSSPELEVYAEDVVCTHGATVGQLDQDAIFYLRSRGIARDEAEQILIISFIKEVLSVFHKYPRFIAKTGLNYDC